MDDAVKRDNEIVLEMIEALSLAYLENNGASARANGLGDNWCNYDDLHKAVDRACAVVKLDADQRGPHPQLPGERVQDDPVHAGRKVEVPRAGPRRRGARVYHRDDFMD